MKDQEVEQVVRALKLISEEPDRFSIRFIQQAASAGALFLAETQPKPKPRPFVGCVGQSSIFDELRSA